MLRFIIQRFCLIAFLAAVESASAHSGYENATEVRIFEDRMELNTRTTFAFEWKLLADRVPADTDESGRKAATPLLAEMAKGLFDVTAAGVQMTPQSAKCIFELDEHIFLRCIYDRPPAWPLKIQATFFDQFDPMNYGSIKVYDQTDASYQRDIKAVAEGKIYRPKPTFIYDPRPSAVLTQDPVPAPSPTEPMSQEFRWYFTVPVVILLLLTGWWWFSRQPQPL